MSNPLQYFADLKDPRLTRTRRHLLWDALLIAMAAICCEASGWNDMEHFGKAKRDWLKSFPALPHGIPSHAKSNRVFQALDPTELEKNFLARVSAIAQRTQGEVIAIDGKSLRGPAGAKSNEITAISKLVRALELSGTTVTIDAMGCQKQIARQIVVQNGDYILAVKDHQPTLAGRPEPERQQAELGRAAGRRAHQATRDNVDGYWLNIPAGWPT